MTIKVGDRLPEADLHEASADGRERVSSKEIFKNRKVVLFAVPGAFTPTCHEMHLPSFLDNLDAIRKRGADLIACVAVNDVDVMKAWAKQSGAQGKITFLADGNGDFTRKVGLDVDYSKYGMGTRSKRYSMIVEDGVVRSLNIEDGPGVKKSGAETILQQL
ncbi:MAG: peroxiredoxin [Pseudomonadota bacterium]|nr:peroxiredoxin [Pseudomonadota bacterium]